MLGDSVPLETIMTDINDLQEAMATWRMAFTAMSDYFEENDILDPVCLEHVPDGRRVILGCALH